MVVLVRDATSRGYKVYECWSFIKAIKTGECTAHHYITNSKGTYFRSISRRCFENADQGNEFYKTLLKEGYIRETSK